MSAASAAPRTLVLILATLALAGPAHAQAPGVDLKLMPKVGGFAPLSELQDVASADGEVTRSLESSLALGLAVELGVPALPGLRLSLDYASSTRLDAEEGFVPEGADADVRVMALVADLVVRRGGVGPLSPYLLLGGGLKWYDFPDALALEDGSDVTGHVGAGAQFDVEVIGLFLEVSDYISRYETAGEGGSQSHLQHDIFVMAGVRIGIL